MSFAAVINDQFVLVLGAFNEAFSSSDYISGSYVINEIKSVLKQAVTS